MQINDPCIITSRLLPGIDIGEATISIEDEGRGIDGRNTWRYYIDLPTKGCFPNYTYENNDLRSGCQGGSIQEGLESLLSFLGAFAESIGYKARYGHGGENADLFPSELAEWAVAHSDEIGMYAIMLEETPDVIV